MDSCLVGLSIDGRLTMLMLWRSWGSRLGGCLACVGAVPIGGRPFMLLNRGTAASRLKLCLVRWAPALSAVCGSFRIGDVCLRPEFIVDII